VSAASRTPSPHGPTPCERVRPAQTRRGRGRCS